MTIETNSAQINVRDNTTTAGVNINSAIGGYGADLSFWGGVAYLCRRKDDPFLRVVLVPSEKWAQDMRDEGYEIIGALGNIAIDQSANKTHP